MRITFALLLTLTACNLFGTRTSRTQAGDREDATPAAREHDDERDDQDELDDPEADEDDAEIDHE